MASQVYALLVGINDYPRHVGRLHGCRNDVQHLHDYLLDTCDRSRLHVETLLDSDATRRNVIDQIKTHLGRARKDDVVVSIIQATAQPCYPPSSDPRNSRRRWNR